MQPIRLLLSSILIVLSASMTPVLAQGVAALQDLETKIARQYNTIAHISPQDLTRLANDPNVLLFDVREEKEFAVSRIPNAQRLSPGVWTSSFLKQYAESAKGKQIVFYCSVGVRSSKVAARVKAGLMENGAVSVANLKGGIFAWHNQGRPLNSATGRTNTVHPFNAYWGKMIRSTANRSYSPIPTSGPKHQSMAPQKQLN